MKRIHLLFLFLLNCAAASPLLLAQGPGSTTPSDVRIDVGGASQTVAYANVLRRIYRNQAPSALVQYLYEPAFLVQFDPVESANQGKLCVDVTLDSDQYKAAVMRKLSQSDQTAVSRIITNGYAFSLGPKLASDPPFGSVPVLVFPSDGGDEVLACFRTPSTNSSTIEAMAAAASLRVSYALPTVDVVNATCSISLKVVNQSIFSNAINGPVATSPLPGGSGAPLQVSLTRNQLASAVNNGFINVEQSCVSDQGVTTQTQLAQDAASKLLPVVISQLALQSVPYDQAVKDLANFSFNGQDAGTTITSFLSNLSTQVHNSSSGTSHVNASASASVLGLFGGSASGDVQSSHAEDSLNTSDAKITWNGSQFVPASLNVFILKGGSNQSIANLSASETTIVGNSVSTRQYFVQLSPLNVPPYATAMPVGSVVPMYLNPTEVSGLAPNWIPADGSTVTDRLSPLNQHVLPDLRGRFVLGSDSGTDVTLTNDININGTQQFRSSAVVTGSTSLAQLNGPETSSCCNTKPYVIDTDTNELKVQDHLHSVTGTAQIDTTLPLPPYRKLIYMIRARP